MLHPFRYPHFVPAAFALLVALGAAPLAAAQGTPVPGAASGTAVPPATDEGKSLFHAVEAQMSTVMQQHQSSFSGIGIRARIGTRFLPHPFELMPGVEYWRNKARLTPYDISGSRKDATLTFDVRYNFENTAFRPYVGTGLGIHFLSSEVDAPAFGLDDESDSLIKGGVAFLGGVDFPLTERINNFLDVKYHHLSDYGQFKINWGIGYRF